MEKKRNEKKRKGRGEGRRCFPRLFVSFCFFSFLPRPFAAYAQAAGGEPVLELAPLVITAPRLKIPKTAVLNPQINTELLNLLNNHANERPQSMQALDPSLQNLQQLTTLDGYNLQTRYTQLGYLLTDGLAGVRNFTLQQALQNQAQSAVNPQIIAASMLALAYTKNPQYLGLFQQALQNQNLTVRFAGIQALSIVGGDAAHASVFSAAQSDASTPLRLYAAHILTEMGDNTGKMILINNYQNSDWLVRAMAVHYLGPIGHANTYQLLFSQLLSENNPIVQAELCAALTSLRQYASQ